MKGGEIMQEEKSKMNEYNTVLSEKDFYPPNDDRVLRSNVFDIAGGDTFEDYAKDYFNMTDELELYDE